MNGRFLLVIETTAMPATAPTFIHVDEGSYLGLGTKIGEVDQALSVLWSRRAKERVADLRRLTKC